MEKVRLTGMKWQKKVYRWHTGYPGGLREMTADSRSSNLESAPELAGESAGEDD